MLRGGSERDRLVGGPGKDVARGHQGRDHCSAEIRKGCERGR
ncbi:hypothetical protein [Nocardioides solisilvae]